MNDRVKCMKRGILQFVVLTTLYLLTGCEMDIGRDSRSAESGIQNRSTLILVSRCPLSRMNHRADPAWLREDLKPGLKSIVYMVRIVMIVFSYGFIADPGIWSATIYPFFLQHSWGKNCLRRSVANLFLVFSASSASRAQRASIFFVFRCWSVTIKIKLNP